MERVSKKVKSNDEKSNDEQLMETLINKYPQYTYRINTKGKVQRLFGKVDWRDVCIHNIRLSTCKEKACGGGTSRCVHNIQKSQCKEPGCGGGSRCKHGRIRSVCRDPECGGGGSYCEHNILRTLCLEKACGGGGSLCKHGGKRSHCTDPECGGGGSLCAHGKERAVCKVAGCGTGSLYCQHGICKRYCRIPECGGGQAYCRHGSLKTHCTEEGCGTKSALCTKCKFRVKQHKDGHCVSCHPNYVAATPSYSKVSCNYLCELEKQYGHPIQHACYQKTPGRLDGAEFTLPEWKQKKVDGYFVDTQQNRKVVIEFLGDYWHGHPRFWKDNPEAKNMYGDLHMDNFYETSFKLSKMVSYGYTVYYVWERDFKKLKALQSVTSILRAYTDNLEW